MDMITYSVNSDDDDDNGWDLGITLTLILESLFSFFILESCSPSLLLGNYFYSRSSLPFLPLVKFITSLTRHKLPVLPYCPSRLNSPSILPKN